MTLKVSIVNYAGLASVALLCAVFAYLLTFTHLPVNSLLWNSVQNAGHSLAFAALTFLSLVLIKPNNERQQRWVNELILFALFLLGAGIECAQYLTGRGASLGDIQMNLAGIGIGAGTFWWAGLLPGNHPLGPLNRAFPALAVIVTLLWCWKKPMLILAINTLTPPLPVIANFEHFGASALLSATEANLEILHAPERWPENQTHVLETNIGAGKWPGFSLIEPHANWSNYNHLNFSVMNASNTAVHLRIRVDTGSVAEENETRSYFSTELKVGVSQISIPLKILFSDGIDKKYSTHIPDTGNVKSLLLFLPQNKSSRTLYFDEFILI